MKETEPLFIRTDLDCMQTELAFYMGISFILYFTHEFKGLEEQTECLR